MDPDREALDAARGLTDALDAVRSELAAVKQSARTSRRIAIGLAASFTLDIILTVVLGFTAYTASNVAASNASLVTGLHAANVTSCHNGDTFRAAQNTIWKDFVGILAKPSPGETKAQIAKTNELAREFLAYVAKVNHPINCSALYGQHGR